MSAIAERERFVDLMFVQLSFVLVRGYGAFWGLLTLSNKVAIATLSDGLHHQIPQTRLIWTSERFTTVIMIMIIFCNTSI